MLRVWLSAAGAVQAVRCDWHLEPGAFRTEHDERKTCWDLAPGRSLEPPDMQQYEPEHVFGHALPNTHALYA